MADPAKRLTEKPELAVKAYSSKQLVFEGQAFSLSAVNNLGPLDILPGHANMLAVLTDCTVRIDAPQGEKKLDISNGILKVYNNQVDVFLNL